MFEILTILFIVLCTFTIYIYVKKRDRFPSFSNLVQTLSVFLALWFTVFTIYSSNTDTQRLFENLERFSSQFSQMDSSMSNVSYSLKDMPDQLRKFSKSVDSLNIVMNNQSKDFKKNTEELNNTILSLSSSVKEYEKNINDYSSQLKSIVELTDKQLVIWEKQQEIVKKEYSRKPIIDVSFDYCYLTDSTLIISGLVLRNLGNIESHILAVFLSAEKNNLKKFDAPGFFQRTDKNLMPGYNVYQFDPSKIEKNEIVLLATLGTKLQFRLEYRNKKKNYIPKLEIMVDWMSRYDNERTKCTFYGCSKSE